MKKKAKSLGKYVPQEIEKKWQEQWKKENLHEFKLNPKKQNYYNLVELPYPSGDLHLGHWFSFVTADTHARFKKMQGYNVFFPNGFDAFGLPAENAAIKRHIHPKDWTMSNIQTMHKQFDTMGTMIDWTHEAITCLPEYYQWNQWIFLKMFEKGLAYRGKFLSNWCPSCQTVLANENIEAGKCWRCGTEVVQKEIEQWFLKLTAYADQLIWPENPRVDWPTSVRVGQNNWIGKKEGINISYQVVDLDEKIVCFTTTPVNFGATFLVVAPEHDFVQKIINKEFKVPEEVYKSVEKYVNQAKKNSQLERMADVAKDKTGVFTGFYVLNHVTKEEIPVWISDFVLFSIGTGAVQGCPGHDLRDFEFAKKFGLPIKRVVTGAHGETDPIERPEQIVEKGSKGKMINSDFLNGIDFTDAMKKTMDYFEEKGWGKRVTAYHIHDWSISRQRYWGTPIPMIHCPKCGIVPVSEKDLPIELPYEVDFTPKGEPPLATAKEWMQVTCPKCGGEAKRDAETMDTFFDSSWYYYRYTDPHYQKGPFDKLKAKKLMPVDIYYGGAEHTLGHTLYARFFTKFFKDLDLVKFDEFAKKRVQHGVILGPDGNRMSKSKGNVVNPDDIVKQYGTDTVRTYLSFMMPYEATSPWSPEAIWGVYRFMRRIWELYEKVSETKPSEKDLTQMYKTIQKVGEDIDQTKFNTAVASLMTWLNYLSAKETVTKEEYKNLLIILAPFAPHMTEEIWQTVNESDSKNDKAFSSIHQQNWPAVDSKLLKEHVIAIIVQVNGKTREVIEVNTEVVEADDNKKIESLALEKDKVKNHLRGKDIKKIIHAKGKVINFIVG